MILIFKVVADCRSHQEIVIVLSEMDVQLAYLKYSSEKNIYNWRNGFHVVFLVHKNFIGLYA